AALMGDAYSLHTPWALPEAMRRGLDTVDDPHRAGPFFLLLPITVQPQTFSFNLRTLPTAAPPPLGAAADGGRYDEAAKALLEGARVVVKAGAGSLAAGAEIERLLELTDGFLVTTPRATGVLPARHPRNAGVGGSKGSISGNHAMENGEVLVLIGGRP